MLDKIKMFIFDLLCEPYNIQNKKKLKTKKQKIILIGTPEHGNIGDLAIAYAEILFLKKYFPNKEVIDIPDAKVKWALKKLKKFLKGTDIIILHGGGNMGKEYATLEDDRRKIIKCFEQYRKIIFPQTFFYKNDENDYLEESKLIYNKSCNLTICGREQYSYDELKFCYPNANIKLIPDIVLSLDGIDLKKERKGVLLCLRHDNESILTEEDHGSILSIVKKYYDNVSYTDMGYGHSVQPNRRKKVIFSKFEEFSKAELVITDRIHGMVFCAITGTPCIALSNYNYKVKGSYKWIKHLEYIKYTESILEIESLIKLLLNRHECKYDNSNLKEYYGKLKECIVN